LWQTPSTIAYRSRAPALSCAYRVTSAFIILSPKVVHKEHVLDFWDHLFHTYWVIFAFIILSPEVGH
jgi:hypothetical protein